MRVRERTLAGDNVVRVRPNAAAQYASGRRRGGGAKSGCQKQSRRGGHMYPQEYREILVAFGWREDPSARTWFAPDGLPLPGISIMKRQGLWCWTTLDFEDNEEVQVGPESLEAYLAFRQPDVDIRRTK